ncbi:hypothetical protein JTB14_009332 [Gonioctena quinquepunctata]|nr:hypothetical protein JTB14_009332 [Gonioctena quinquepunctata]
MLDEDMEKSHSGNSMVSVRNIDIPIEGNERNETVKDWINNIPEDIPEEVENKPENNDIKLLCDTLSNVIKNVLEDRNSDRMDTARNHRKNAGTHSSDPNFEWPIGFGNANVISKDNVVNEPPKEDRIMTSHQKTHSIHTTKSRLSNTSTDIQRKRLAIEAEKQNIENRMMEMETKTKKVKYLKQLKLIEMERQVQEAEIVENEERRSQPTSMKSNSVSNRNVYTEGIVHNPNVESCSCKSSLMPAAENQQLRRNPVSRVNSYVTDWVNALEPFVKMMTLTSLFRIQETKMLSNQMLINCAKPWAR